MAKNKWKEAIVDELEVLWLYTEELDKDPKKALSAIIKWHIDDERFLEKQNRWYNRARTRLESLYYRTFIPYLYWKITGKDQPPF